MWLSLMVTILTKVLIWLFEQWLSHHTPSLKKKRGMATSVPDLEEGRAEFLRRIGWRFWYGKDRIALANKMFDAAKWRYKSGRAMYALPKGGSSQDAYNHLASALTNGLDKEIQ